MVRVVARVRNDTARQRRRQGVGRGDRPLSDTIDSAGGKPDVAVVRQNAGLSKRSGGEREYRRLELGCMDTDRVVPTSQPQCGGGVRGHQGTFRD